MAALSSLNSIYILDAWMFIGGLSLSGALRTVARLERQGMGSILDYAKEGSKTLEDVHKYVSEMERWSSKEAKQNVFTALKLSSFLYGSELKPKVARDELYSLLHQLRGRAIMFDAETPSLKALEDHTYRAITADFPDLNIYKTIQAYRVDSIYDVHQAIYNGFPVKLVRGAYWEQDDMTFFQSKAQTDFNYNKLARMLITWSHVPICIATHNTTSIELVKEIMQEPHSRVIFAQLLGMGDKLGARLVREGYPVYKYVPYGSLCEIAPYLGRRLVENIPILTHVIR